MREKQIRVLMALAGVLICGFSVGLFKMAMLGTDPFTSFSTGIWMITNIGYGTFYTIVNLIIFAGVFIVKRHYIGIATFFNIFFAGYVTEYTTKFLSRYIQKPDVVEQALLLILGVIIMCFAASLYFTADMGVSAYDAVALILRDKKIAPFQACRIGTDFVCVAIGVLLKASVGIGTVITALFMGPLIEYFNRHFSRPFLEKSKKQEMRGMGIKYAK